MVETFWFDPSFHRLISVYKFQNLTIFNQQQKKWGKTTLLYRKHRYHDSYISFDYKNLQYVSINSLKL